MASSSRAVHGHSTSVDIPMYSLNRPSAARMPALGAENGSESGFESMVELTDPTNNHQVSTGQTPATSASPLVPLPLPLRVPVESAFPAADSGTSAYLFLMACFFLEGLIFGQLTSGLVLEHPC